MDEMKSGKSETVEEKELATLQEAYLERLTKPGAPFNLSEAFPLPERLDDLYTQLTELKACLDSFRPLDQAQAQNLREAFDTEYTYHSNKIEGNTLTLRETDLIVNKGLTISGKSMREHLEAANHQEAIAVIRDLVARNEEVTAANVARIHSLILHGINHAVAGVYRSIRVFISGSQHVPPNPQRVPDLMDGMFAFYDANKSVMHPVELAAQMHEKIATIHPFVDGNGRTARLLMNLILLRNGYPITVISGERKERQTYYESLEAANLSPTGDNSRFQRFIAENVRAWLMRYLEIVSVDVTEHGKSKGLHFFRTIAPSLKAQ